MGRPSECGNVQLLMQKASETITKQISAAEALAYYTELRVSDGHLTVVQDLAVANSKYTAFAYYAALVRCAAFAGQPQFLMQILNDMGLVGVKRRLSLYETTMRLLASK